MKLPIYLTKEPRILQVGGAMVGNKTSLSKYINFGISIPEDKFIIAVSYLLKENLEPMEFLAIVNHELGHYSLGHLSKNSPVPKLEQELQADRYSVSKTSATALYSGLHKLVPIYKAYTTSVVKNKSNEKELLSKIDSFIEHVQRQMQPRYDALQKMINDGVK